MDFNSNFDNIWYGSKFLCFWGNIKTRDFCFLDPAAVKYLRGATFVLNISGSYKAHQGGHWTSLRTLWQGIKLFSLLSWILLSDCDKYSNIMVSSGQQWLHWKWRAAWIPEGSAGACEKGKCNFSLFFPLQIYLRSCSGLIESYGN